VFRAEVQGLPRPEPMFSVRYINPKKLNSVLKNVQNLVFVTTLDKESLGARIIKGYFTPESINRIKSDESLYVHTDNDVFSKGQKVMYLFGQTEEALIEKLNENGERIAGVFNKAERERTARNLFKSKEQKGVSEMLQKSHECHMRIPFGYQIAVNEPGFVWLRNIGNEIDRNVFITYRNYTNPAVFEKDNLVQLRDSIARQQLFEDPDRPDTYLVTETTVPAIPIRTRQITLNEHYSVEMKGLWRTNIPSMGGPFVSYALVDESTNRLFYIEGFVISPGKSQRETMRELEVILSTFKPQSMANK
jgi:hypothetical protein